MRASRTSGAIGFHLAVGVVLLALTSCGSGDDITPVGASTSAPDGATGGPMGSLTPTSIHYVVTGMVRDQAGRPVARTMITAVSLEHPARPVPEQAVLSDGRGHYGWPGLKPGRYELRVSTPGGRAAVQIDVPASGSTTADLTLAVD
jgi:hypothetical protein